MRKRVEARNTKSKKKITYSETVLAFCFLEIFMKKNFSNFWQLFLELFNHSWIFICVNTYPLDTGRKLNVHKMFIWRPGRLLNVICTFNLHPVPRGYILLELFCKEFANFYSLQNAFSFVICKNFYFPIASAFKVISFWRNKNKNREVFLMVTQLGTVI